MFFFMGGRILKEDWLKRRFKHIHLQRIDFGVEAAVLLPASFNFLTHLLITCDYIKYVILFLW